MSKELRELLWVLTAPLLWTLVMVIVLLVASRPCEAAPTAPAATHTWTVGLHLFSRHTDRAGWIDGNHGAYVLHQPSGLTAGLVRNSYGRGSVYLAHTWQTNDQRWAVTVGGITGYPGSRIAPLLTPSMRIGIGQDAALRISYLPKPPKLRASDALHLSVEFPLGSLR